jgi:hypothetical protein
MSGAVMNLYRKFTLRFSKTEALLNALVLLDNAMEETPKIRNARLLVAGELIRRGEIFW